MYYNKFLIIICVLFCFLSIGSDLRANAPSFYTTNPEKIMLDGYDILTYYTNSYPLKGAPEYQVEFQGVKWHFTSKTNMNKFQRNPGMYVPEFGGYCVWAIAHGRLTGGLPNIWKIVDGRLYLFCSESSKEKWMKQRELIIRFAQENWPEILNQ